MHLFCSHQNQTQTQPLIKTPPAVLQPIAQQPTFSVQAQPQPQSLLQAQISAASITPLLQTQPQPLLQQPQQKGISSIHTTCFCFSLTDMCKILMLFHLFKKKSQNQIK